MTVRQAARSAADTPLRIGLRSARQQRDHQTADITLAIAPATAACSAAALWCSMALAQRRGHSRQQSAGSARCSPHEYAHE